MDPGLSWLTNPYCSCPQILVFHLALSFLLEATLSSSENGSFPHSSMWTAWDQSPGHSWFIQVWELDPRMACQSEFFLLCLHLKRLEGTAFQCSRPQNLRLSSFQPSLHQTAVCQEREGNDIKEEQRRERPGSLQDPTWGTWAPPSPPSWSDYPIFPWI